ncbi:MAG TPA: hypothetical protein VHB02_08075 [Acidimicrobiales bacterium]|nr:hypothetical protein [Acidimicrobiales bacterium]
MFPPYVRGADEALDYLTTWCDIIGGELLDGIGWDEIVGEDGRLAMLQVRPFRIRFSVGTVLSVAFAVGADLTARFYRFDLRQDGELCWRHDCHAGHEYLGSGLYHLHVGPDERDRHPDEPQTLQTIFEHVTAENLRRSWQPPDD